MRGEHAPPRRLGGMRGEDELERELPRRALQLIRRDAGPLEALHRIRQRLARYAPLVLVLAPASEPVVLLRQVDELEVDAERTQDERLALRLEVGDGRPEPRALCRTAGRARGPGEEPYLLLQVEQLLSFLLDEDPAEDRSEEPNVPSERCIRRGELIRQSTTPSRSSSASPSGSTTIGCTQLGDGLRRLQAVARDEKDDGVVLSELASAHGLAQGAERDARLPSRRRRRSSRRAAPCSAPISSSATA